MAHGTPVAVGFGNRKGPGHERTVTPPPARIGHRIGAGRGAVPRAVEPDDLEATGIFLRQTKGCLVAFATCVQEDELGQALRQQRGHPSRQRGHGGRQHAAEQMEHLAATRFDGRDDRRVVVPEGGAHLARGEIENGTPILVVDVRAACTHNEFGMKLGAVADQVVAHRGSQNVQRLQFMSVRIVTGSNRSQGQRLVGSIHGFVRCAPGRTRSSQVPIIAYAARN